MSRLSSRFGVGGHPRSTPAGRATPPASLEEPSEVMHALARRLLCADNLEVLVDEDVVRPVDADVVDVVLAVAQLDYTVNDAPWVGGQRSSRHFIRRCSADDRPRPLTPVRRDLTDPL